MTHPNHDHELAELRRQMDGLALEIRELTTTLARDFANGEIASLSFDGSKGITQVTDDHGSNALAYALYNQTAVPLFLHLVGGELEVPAHKLLVAPVTINGAIQVSANAEKLAETRIQVFRWRFPTPQAFAVHALQ